VAELEERLSPDEFFEWIEHLKMRAEEEKPRR
jgi:hypothetical protein